MCGREVFEGVRSEDIVSWNSLLLGYFENANLSVALDLFTSMDCEPSSLTYIVGLKACGGLASEKKSDKGLYLEKGITIHKGVKEHGFKTDIVVATNLLEMYSKCGSMHHAREVFESMFSQDAVAWNTLILRYVENGDYAVAMDLFSIMDCEPNCVTYLAALKACGGLASEPESEKQHHLQKGIGIHKKLQEGGFGSDIVVATTLVDMYGECGSMQNARDVFDRMIQCNAVTWTSLILGYVGNGQCSEAMDLFARMDCERGSTTYVAALKA
ncbi:pentatricopeptide repeat-containing protein At1g11290, chloroplastic-like [Selaginella moellendorffii]|uniref:pentatricopeptide repeat-containing protein At1g11290, chloroplastic-like n=1 Tax=Selaginella moellendorffii TaxID=88036 RepID=UPI000D1CAEC5|nr:pentatricopeptide repeat-containing protein At1g11290, chloroplastic-like [Selaginella moellendorffii]|eukprot:XP_024519596.1 pentatricopeptide repeat-containing protein At1g11290, chloroplastic-like [Selaginella moellendorffii]